MWTLSMYSRGFDDGNKEELQWGGYSSGICKDVLLELGTKEQQIASFKVAPILLFLEPWTNGNRIHTCVHNAQIAL